MDLDAGDANLYRYVGNDPVNRTGPIWMSFAIFMTGWSVRTIDNADPDVQRGFGVGVVPCHPYTV